MNKTLKILDFYASWCQPCQRMKPAISELISEYEGTEVTIKKIDLDTEEGGTLARQYGVVSIPNLIFLDKEDVLVGQMIGGNTKQTVKNKIEALLEKQK